jgi:Tfp pilus assembly protein PilF
MLGAIYIDEGHYTDARREYDAVLAADPFYADAFYGMGLLYEKTGDYVKARAEWRRALQYDVNHQGALQKLADSR